jgi:ssDNA-binding Zn-finger/Zn-ribbon topoisomerase 1
MPRKKTQAEFIERAIQIHGDKYTYEKTVYRGRHAKLVITCLEHGDFEQASGDHLGNHGCPNCKAAAASVRKASNLEKFIEAATQLHDARYSYENSVYRGSSTKLLITCPNHGDFPQRPNDHLMGHGCVKCRDDAHVERRCSTLEKFIEAANVVHHGKYSYPRAVYVNSFTKLWITCPDHGDFEQAAYSHLSGIECPGCGADAHAAWSASRRSTTAEFIEGATRKHRGKYAYPRSVYVNNWTKLTITCSEHGDFEQTPSDHLGGVGCPKCAASKGEIAICRILDAVLPSTGISYKPGHRIRECRYKRPLPFDFALMRSGTVVGLIEYHGRQHYETPYFWGLSQERANVRLAGVQERDGIKVQYAAAKGIPLLVIPHWDFGKIEALVTGFVQSL